MNLTDEELVAGFESASLSAGSFHHRDHVRMAWITVRRFGLPTALGVFSDGLRRLATAAGKPGLYHETITWAFMILVAERQARSPAATWSDFARMNGDLLTWQPSILAKYYEDSTLRLEISRHTFLMPDRIRQDVCAELPNHGDGVREEAT